MKTPTFNILLLGTLLVIALPGSRTNAADPRFTYSWSSNQLTMTVTNHTLGALYEIYTRPVLGDSLYPWTFMLRGAVNQTNFVISDVMVEPTGFFQLAVGKDWDGDGAENDVDAQPSNSGVGALSITIDYPTQGLVLQ